MTPPTSQPPRPTVQENAPPAMPRIPGVTAKPARAQFQPKRLLIGFLATLFCVSGFALWLSRRPHADVGPDATYKAPALSASMPVSSPENTNIGPRAVATLEELETPWSSKNFNFVDPKTQDNVAAIVIRLPGSGQSLWAFSLSAPLTRSPLQYVTDLNVLSQRFAYRAAHPMIISECDGTIYDPLKMATLADGSWTRGDIVRGGAIRPPLAIQIEVRGRDLIAQRME